MLRATSSGIEMDEPAGLSVFSLRENCRKVRNQALLLTRQVADDLRLTFPVRFSIRIENIVEPDRRLTVYIRALPRIPRQIRLALAGNQAPVDRADTILFRDRQYRVE